MKEVVSREVLLVEDNAADVRLTREAFRAVGSTATLEVAPDGEYALTLLRRRVTDGVRLPDLVLLDLNLPRLDGLGVLEALDGDPELGSLPVVVLTTSDQPSDVDRAYALHANGYVVKPLEFDGFIDAVASVQDFWLRSATLPGSRHPVAHP